ncbi:Bug family tripartite tricarboxylate transporter substrate binding protein [Saliphagus sp. GCM10025334]
MCSETTSRRRILEAVGGATTIGLGGLAGCLSDFGDNSDDSEYPNQAIDLWIPYSEGGGIDMSARALKPYLEDELGTSLAAQQVTGGGGGVAMERIFNETESDGYTLSVMTTEFMYLMQKMFDFDYEPSELTFIYQWASDPFLIAVNADSEWETVDDVIQASQEEEIRWGQVAMGGSDHLAMLRLREETDFQGRPVSFNGGGESSAALIGDRIEIDTPTLSTGWPRIDSGDIRPIAITAPSRDEYEPLQGVYSDVPTLPETGIIDDPIRTGTTRILVGPPDLPNSIVETVSTAMENASAVEEWQEQARNRRELVDRRGAEGAKEFFESLVDEYEPWLDPLQESVNELQ